ncbi:hypothetical protein RA178_06355 [Shewanella oncorhynchi]|uniref:Uncharacterized protein n=1 Tax=Shewanella oncorhynchi TaxID=2726434 RepID=A0AA50KFG5_9GAMM|nr:hypothetical protein [Shewanella oncorhynchi]WMB74234.1 hypothetical protein RA178_06355 [Shewanella oncorhynchi]
MILNILKTSLIKVVMSFFGEKIIIKACFGLLKTLAAKTTNTLDDQLVKDAEDSYYGHKES